MENYVKRFLKYGLDVNRRIFLDDGKVLKVVNVASDTSKAFVISDNDVFPKGTAIRQLTLAPGYGKVVAVSKGETKLVTLNHCKFIATCR